MSIVLHLRDENLSKKSRSDEISVAQYVSAGNSGSYSLKPRSGERLKQKSSFAATRLYLYAIQYPGLTPWATVISPLRGLRLKVFARSLFFSLLFCFFLVSFASAQQKTQQNAQQKTQQNAQQNDTVGEEKEITLEFKTQLVVVPFSAIDRTNRPVNDLKAEDIKLFENGQPAQLASLQRSNNQALNFAILLDYSGSMQPFLDSARQSALRFFDKAINPEKDRVGVVAFQQEIVLAQPLTNNKTQLKKALERNYMILPSPSTLGPSLDMSNKRLIGTALYGAIYVAVDELLQTTSGHRVLLLISDGYDSESGIELRDALDYAWRREVTIYTLGLGDQSGLNKEVLERLCSATGGRAFYPKDSAELDQAFQQINEDLRQQYILSFYPNAEADNLFRTIKIDIPSRPSLNIRHRFGYYNSLVENEKQ